MLDGLDELAAELIDRIRSAARRRGLTVQTPGIASAFAVVLADHEPTNYRDLARADKSKRRLLDLRLLAEGVYSRPRDRFNLSLAHTREVIAGTGEAFERAMSAL